ncbi:MAG: two-component sensor histidine kinase [Acidobacteria bacterium]|nr:MAG: two-component sensor histidine kinase [Acidobacteriota bacterium]
MRKLSIGMRLTLWYVAIFAVGELVFGASMFLILRHNLYDLVDDGLESQIEDLRNFLGAQQKDASTAKLREEMAAIYEHEHAGDFLAVLDQNGELIYRSMFLQTHESAPSQPGQVNRPLIRTRRINGEHFRFAFEKLNVDGRVYTLEMGAPADDAFETLQLFRSYLLIFAPLLLVVSTGVGYWMSRKALAPMDALVRTARDISGTNLNRRLQTLKTGDELQRLTDTLNEMLDRIESAFQKITQFTADASHELRTPVSLIRTEAELALRRARTETEYEESLRQILKEAERTTLLIEQLLELARADSGRGSLIMQAVDLPEVLRSVVSSWQQVAEARSLQFSTDIHKQDASVMGDATLLRRLADILLDNAFKYTPSPGSVRLVLEVRQETAVITVQDSGAGIAQEDQEKIFERFYRVDKARSRGQGGVGLGLAIAEWIVLQHRGAISVVSRPGEGATFRAELPLIAVEVPSPLLTK